MASAQDLFGQLWKEYALSDSRYMTSDTVVLCMETMTVVSGLKLLIARPSDIDAHYEYRFCGDHFASRSHI